MSPPSACTPGDDGRFIDPTVLAAAPRFTIFETGIFADVELRKRSLIDEGLDDHISVDLAQHLSELNLLDGLKRHPRRVVSDAELHVPVALAFPSVLFGRLNPDPSWGSAYAASWNTRASHNKRMERLQIALESSSAYQQRKPFLFLHSYWDISKSFTPPLLWSISRQRGGYLATADSFWSELPPNPFSTSLNIPYRAHYLTARRNTSSAYPFRLRRGIIFHGALTNQHNIMRPGRAELAALRDELRVPFSLVTGQNASFGWSNRGLRRSAAANAAAHYSARSMLTAQLCLIPEGDSITSRRLYDALAAGCVPVLLRLNVTTWNDELPFPDIIDWRSIALVHAWPAPISATARWLEGHAANTPTLEAMSARGREVFEKYLDIDCHPAGVAAAMLATVGRLLSRSQQLQRSSRLGPYVPTPLDSVAWMFDSLNMSLGGPNLARRMANTGYLARRMANTGYVVPGTTQPSVRRNPGEAPRLAYQRWRKRRTRPGNAPLRNGSAHRKLMAEKRDRPGGAR